MEINKIDVNEAVVEFCIDVIKNPLMYFNESDLHLLLCNKINSKFNNELRKNEFDTDLKPILNDSNSKYETCLLHLEYGVNEGRAMDIVILDEADIKNINHYNLQHKDGSDIEYLKPKFGFELGTEKIGLDKDNIKKHIENDTKKLEKCGNGYLIHIIRDTNQGEQDDKKKLLEDRFKNPIKETYGKLLKIKSPIRIIAILIYLFRKKSETRCEIFNKKLNQWEPFYEEDIHEERKIEELLESQLQ